jgi:hypothetical protein
VGCTVRIEKGCQKKMMMDEMKKGMSDLSFW